MGNKRLSFDNPAVCSKCGYQPATVSISFCPGCGSSFVPASRSRKRKRIGWFAIPAMLYPRSYKWFVFISALDVILTWFILLLGGSEVNLLADAVIASTGLQGILIYKFCLVLIVIMICEVVGRRRPKRGRNLAIAAIAISALPVVASIAQLVTT